MFVKNPEKVKEYYRLLILLAEKQESKKQTTQPVNPIKTKGVVGNGPGVVVS